MKRRTGFLLLTIVILAVVFAVQAAPPLSGAIFTTTVDGTIVNENVRYEAKEDVYLDGGPGPNAPPGAAGLPEGDYYFQVTDPSGQDLLSSDHISCRKIHVNALGFIDHYYTDGMNLAKVGGVWTEVPCEFHNTGVDADQGDLGAITVQLYPYDDTPNRGGVYKAWVTPVEDYAGVLPDCVGQHGSCDVNGEDYSPGNLHGFIPAASKTDNYKVRRQGNFVAPVIYVRKFHDKNLNGVQDVGEEDVGGWEITIADPLGVANVAYTPVVYVADAGTYVLTEETPAGTLQTVSYLDGAIYSLYPLADPTVNVLVEGKSAETHSVVFGNVGIGAITVCKVFDANADGVADPDEPPVAGWPMTLSGTNALGETVGPIIQYTGDDGCTTFDGLLPGTYVVTEATPTGWYASGPVSADCSVQSALSGSEIYGATSCTDAAGAPFNGNFTNYCVVQYDFDTKGYWHNKNGLTEIEEAFVTGYVNGLDPYDDPTSYFGDGDEPFDGFLANGDLVAPAFNDQGDPIWGGGTMQAEISHFLVDANAGGDPREQLAQQLLAFIFNTQYRLGGNGTIQQPDGTFVLASDLIADAIQIWQSGTHDEQVAMAGLLDSFNNNDSVNAIPGDPAACPPITP